MNKKHIIVVAIVATIAFETGGCYPYKDYLYSLPVTERTHNDEAIAIISEVYGIDHRVPEVRWVVQDTPILTQDGGNALGMTIDCTSWVWWPPLYGTNPRDSLTFGHTVMAHEVAHCAMWLYGLNEDSNTNHTDPVWWGTPGEGGGLVRVAMDELIERGM